MMTAPSERVILSAPLSFVGSTRRLWRLLHPNAFANVWAKIGLWMLLVVLLVLAWTVVLAWYCLFGLLLVPYRIIRRSQRRGRRNALRHREILAALEAKGMGE